MKIAQNARVKQAVLSVMALVLNGIAQTTDIDISGRVTDWSGEPLAGAVVVLRTLGDSTTTEDDGSYSFRMAMPMGSDRIPKPAKKISLAIQNNLVRVVSCKNAIVSVELINVRGQTVLSVMNRKAESDLLTVNLSTSANRVGSSILLLRISIDASVRVFKGVHLGSGTQLAWSLVSGKALDSNPESHALSKLEAANGVDEIAAMKAGWVSGYQTIGSYKQSVPDIKLYKPLGMKPVRSGTFSMGYALGTANQKPAHTVTLAYDYFMDSVEVTQAEYAAILRWKPWTEVGDLSVGDRYPAYNMTWFDAALFCNAKSKRNGLDTVYTYISVNGVPGYGCIADSMKVDLTKSGYRLPTEAEWELACRAGTTMKYYWGDDTAQATVKQFGWYELNADSGYWTLPHAARNGAQEVALKTPNANGLYDMSGNVSEWCNDWFRSDAYATSPIINPTGPQKDAVRKVARGGSWYSSNVGLSSFYRYSYKHFAPSKYVGFRTVLPAQRVTAWGVDSSRSTLPFPGRWSGGLMTFTVSSTQDYIEQYSFGPLSFSGGYCSSFSTTTSGYYLSFSTGSFYSSSNGLTLSGSFQSSSSASGSYSYNQYNSDCGTTFSRSGSWTATYQPEVMVPTVGDTTVLLPPSSPSLSSPQNGATDIPANATLLWSSVGNASVYKVQVSTDSLFDSLVINASWSTGAYAMNGLSYSTRYFWRIRAESLRGGLGPWTEAWSFTTASAPPPVAPMLISPYSGATAVLTSPVLSWNSSTGATKYHVQVSLISGFTTAAFQDSTLSSTSATVPALNPSTMYYWKVRAGSSGGWSAWSSYRYFTTQTAPPGPPTTPTPISPLDGVTGVATAPTFSWSSSATATRYRVQVSTGENFTPVLFDDSLLYATTTRLTSLELGTTYFWRVSAKNVSGASGWSNAVSFTTTPNSDSTTGQNLWATLMGTRYLHISESAGVVEPPAIAFGMPKDVVQTMVGIPDSSSSDQGYDYSYYSFDNCQIALCYQSGTLFMIAANKTDELPSIPRVQTDRGATLEYTRNNILSAYGVPHDDTNGQLAYLIGRMDLTFEPAGEGQAGATIALMDLSAWGVPLAKRRGGKPSPF